MTLAIDPDLRRRIDAALGERFRIDDLVAHSDERVLFRAFDKLLRRPVSLRVNADDQSHLRRWFLKEAEALGRLDHPAIRHLYEAAIVDGLAYRVGNWVDGESLEAAVQRGPRPVPTVHVLARDLLSGLEHAHAYGLIIRRIVPGSLILSSAGRPMMTDLRFCSLTLPEIPASEKPPGPEFLAPEVRGGHPGDPTSDVYTVGAILYFAVTGTTPPLDPAALVPPTIIRPVIPRALERVIQRALDPDHEERYHTAAEMLEDFASDAGEFEGASVSLPSMPSGQYKGMNWENRLRRALGDDYELLEPLGEGGFGPQVGHGARGRAGA